MTSEDKSGTATPPKRTLTGWQAAVEAIAAEGVRRVYGLPGDPTHLYDALYDAPTIDPVLVRHECSGVFMAMAEARLGHGVGVCHASPGPGMTNTVSGLLEAFSGCTPIVCITTGAPAAFFGMGAFQENDSVAVARPVTKWSVRVERPDRVGWTMRRAFSIAAGGKPGPVLVEIPADVGVARAEMDEYRPAPRALRTAPDPELTEAAAVLLREARRPVIVAGGGVISSEAGPALVALAEQESMPIMTSASGRGAVAENHPLAFGLVGLYRTRPGRDIFNDADLLVTVGCRMESVQSGNWSIFPAGARMVQIDVDPFEIGRNFVPDVAVVSDARLALVALSEVLRDQGGRRAERARHVAESLADKELFIQEVEAECASSMDIPLRSKRIVHELNAVYGPDTVLVNENGGQDLLDLLLAVLPRARRRRRRLDGRTDLHGRRHHRSHRRQAGATSEKGRVRGGRRGLPDDAARAVHGCAVPSTRHMGSAQHTKPRMVQVAPGPVRPVHRHRLPRTAGPGCPRESPRLPG